MRLRTCEERHTNDNKKRLRREGQHVGPASKSTNKPAIDHHPIHLVSPCIRQHARGGHDTETVDVDWALTGRCGNDAIGVGQGGEIHGH